MATTTSPHRMRFMDQGIYDKEDIERLERRAYGYIREFEHGGTEFLERKFGRYPTISNRCIDCFISSCGLYDPVTKKWKPISDVVESQSNPQVPSRPELPRRSKKLKATQPEVQPTGGRGFIHETDLYDAFTLIFRSALHRLKLEGKRTVYAVRAEDMKKPGSKSVSLEDRGRSIKYPPPAFAFGATKRDQNLPKVDKDHRWTSVIQVAPEAFNYDLEDGLGELGVYARLLFQHQPHRWFAYGAILSEESMRVYQFDRGGGICSELFNIHKDPATFIRVILHMASDQPELIGLNPKIYWKNLRGTREAQGYLKTVKVVEDPTNTRDIFAPGYPNADEEVTVPVDLKIIKLLYVEPHTYVGRHTICWLVENGSEKLVVKELWRDPRTLGRKNELDFMRKIQGWANTAQLWSAEKNTMTVADLRGCIPSNANLGQDDGGEDDGGVTYDGFRRSRRNFIWTRFTMAYYPYAFLDYADPSELLQIAHDTVAVLGVLKGFRITYGDLSEMNIRLDVKRVGTLIDFDSADDAEDGFSPHLRGTRRYFSLSILNSAGEFCEENWCQDHFDDLESLFYLLLSTCTSMRDPSSGYLHQHQPLVQPWFQGNEKLAWESKKSLFIEGFPEGWEKQLNPEFPPEVFGPMFEAIRVLLFEHAVKPKLFTRKHLIRDRRPTERFEGHHEIFNYFKGILSITKKKYTDHLNGDVQPAVYPHNSPPKDYNFYPPTPPGYLLLQRYSGREYQVQPQWRSSAQNPTQLEYIPSPVW